MVREMTLKMASLSDLASHHHHHHHHSNKITKAPRGGKMVKPILKRLASSSSPKNSLDLDRGWEDQAVDLGCAGNNNSSITYESSGRPSMSPSIRDVSFQFPPSWEPTGYGGGVGGVGGVGGGGSATGSGATTPVGAGLEATSSIHVGVTSSTRNLSRGRYQHARSTSAASHVSIGTNGSNHRPGGGSFVHPFQQTPRTHTPPLTYANSFTSFERENNPARDYSPTIITENDDDDEDQLEHHNQQHHHHHLAGSISLSQSLAASSHLHRPQPSNSHSTANLRRPSLASQRTSSLSDIRSHTSSSNNNNNNAANPNPPLRVNTTPSFPRSVPTSSRLAAHGSLSTANSNSISDLHLNLSPTDSPRPSLHLASPTNSSATAMSPLRTSLEGAFRLRSRSEVDMGARQDIREARRKFEENERIKQEKYEAEQRRKQERRQEKERAAAARRSAGGGGEKSPSIGRSSFSRRRSPPLTSTASNASGTRRTRSGESAIHQHNHRSGGGGGVATTTTTINEKAEGMSTGFLSSNYESTADGAAPSFGQDVMDVRFETPKRTTTAKRKTQSYWTSFVLWFRTRLLKLGRR